MMPPSNITAFDHIHDQRNEFISLQFGGPNTDIFMTVSITRGLALSAARNGYMPSVNVWEPFGSVL